MNQCFDLLIIIGYFSPWITINPDDVIIHVLIAAVDEAMAGFVPKVSLDGALTAQISIYRPPLPVLYTNNLDNPWRQQFYLSVVVNTIVQTPLPFDFTHFVHLSR